MPKQFKVTNMAEAEPLTFQLVDQRGVVIPGPGPEQSFRASPRPRLDLVQAMVDAVVVHEGTGFKAYNLDILRRVITESLIVEEWVPPQVDGNEGAWRPAPDRHRFEQVLDSDRWTVRIDTLGEIAVWLVEETTSHPTGGLSRSADGPVDTSVISTVAGPSPASTGPNGSTTAPVGSTPST